MKIIISFLILLLSICAWTQNINSKLIGNWESELVDTKKNTTYYVLIKRFDDGTFDSLLMIHKKGDTPEHYGGSGYWRVEGNQLYLEYILEDSDETVTEVMQFEIINEKEIHILSKDKDRPKALKDYIEYKK